MIKNKEVYLSRLDKGLEDKAWWIKEIPETITTVIDFGCAGGALYLYLEKYYPNRFNYIGIEDNADFFPILHKNGIHNFYTSLDNVPPVENAIVVMNSVVHEIFTYKSDEYFWAILDKLFKRKIDYIAIRDMYFSKNQSSYIDMISGITWSKYSHLWYDFINESPTGPIEKIIAEFFLKYTYEENWEREKHERYFCSGMFEEIALAIFDHPEYTILKQKFFQIPEQKARIDKDFGVDFNANTHCKVLIGRK